jgi:anti-sigma factor RsiW
MASNAACQTFLPQLSPFVDGELAPAERAVLERHLSACRDCTARVADFRAESGLLRHGMELLADEADFRDFAQKVLAQVTPERPPLWERWKLAVSEYFVHHRAVMVSSLVTALVVAAVAAPLIFRERPPLGYAAEHLTVEAVTPSEGVKVAPVVLTDQGNAIIWMVDEGDKELGEESEEEERGRDDGEGATVRPGKKEPGGAL